jgi:hypothetical protein
VPVKTTNHGTATIKNTSAQGSLKIWKEGGYKMDKGTNPFVVPVICRKKTGVNVHGDYSLDDGFKRNFFFLLILLVKNF